jgi:hypothetical protein
MAEEVKSLFDLEEFKPYGAAFQARKSRFARFWRHYKAELTAPGEWATDMGSYIGATIANAVKPIFTPLARAVELDVALIPGDWKLSPESAKQQMGLDRIFEWSKWDCEGDIFVRYVTALGEAGLRVVDDRVNKRLIIQPVRPDMYLAIPMSAWDNTPKMLITLAKMGEDEIAEVIEPNRIRTFWRGQPYAQDALNGREAEYANELGFVPFVVCKLDSGDGAGEPTFDNTLPALDQANRQATYMATIIQRHAEPQWAVIGAEAGDLEKSGEAVWFFPEGSDVKAVLAAVDFAGLLAFIQEIKKEMKDSLPELALSELVGVERVAAATIELQMAEAVFKIRRLRKPHDRALMEAVVLAGKAAISMGLADLAGLADGTLRFDKNRPVITVDALTRLQIESVAQSQEMSRLAMERERMLLAASNGQEEGADG